MGEEEKLIQVWYKFNQSKVEDNLKNHKNITQYCELPYADTLDLLGHTFVCEKNDTDKRDEVNKFL